MVADSRTAERCDMSRPLHVGVVGAGPAGIYVSDTLIRQLRARGEELGIGSAVHIDVIERLPVPFGLVRYGVAPDHPAIKWIMAALEKAVDQPEIQLFTNVAVGASDDGGHADLTVADLLAHEDLVIFATGAIANRPLSIPGHDLPQVHGAAQLVEWYDGYPHENDSSRIHTQTSAQTSVFDPSARSIAVIGGGNVALDITRMLANDPTALLATDIPDHVQQALARSAVQTIHVLVRRGPAQAKFSVQELRQLEKVPNVVLRVDPDDFKLDPQTLKQAHADRETGPMLDELLAIAHRSEQQTQSQSHPASHPARTVWFHFYSSPDAIVAQPSSQTVRVVRIRRTTVSPDGHMTVTDHTREIQVQAVYAAIGYQPSALPGVPFDSERHVLANVDGRIVENEPQHTPIPREYATGWAKRGPVGLIGSTKADAKQTVAHILTDIARDPHRGRDPHVSQALATGNTLEHVLQSRHVAYGDLEGWKRVDAAEREEGQKRGRSRMVITDRERLIRLAEHR